MGFDFSILLDYWPLFLRGALVTLQIAAIAFAGGMLLASALSAASFLPFRPLKAAIALYLLVMRGVPFIVLLFLVHFGLPFFGVRIPAFFTGTLALTLYASAYYTEVIRATVLGLPRGQWESARAIGMSPIAAARYIIVPQILRPALPPLVNCTITMIKESAVISGITVGELTYQGLVVQGNTFAPFEVFFAVAGLYWLMTLTLSRIARYVERRIGDSQGAAAGRTGLADRYLSLEARSAR